MILRITDLRLAGNYLLRVAFNDGTCKTVDLFPLLDGPIFEPLKDPEYFAQVALDPVSGTAVWPNDADFAPEALHDLVAAEEMTGV